MASSILYVVAFFDALEQEACDQKLSSKFLVCLVSSKSLGNNQDYNNLAIQHRRVRKVGGGGPLHISLSFLPLRAAFRRLPRHKN